MVQGMGLGRQYHFKFFDDCLPQILRGPFLNTLSQMFSLQKKQHSTDCRTFPGIGTRRSIRFNLFSCNSVMSDRDIAKPLSLENCKGV